MSDRDSERELRIVEKAFLIQQLLIAFNIGRNADMAIALRVLAKVAETERELDLDELKLELQFLVRDDAGKVK